DGSRTSDEIRLVAFAESNRKGLPEGQPENVAGRKAAQKRQSNRKSVPIQPEAASGLTTFEPSEEPSESSVPNGTGAEPSPDLDKRGWDEAVICLRRGGMTEPKARKMFGKLLRDHKLTARDLLPSLLNAQVIGTADPQSYLVRA